MGNITVLYSSFHYRGYAVKLVGGIKYADNIQKLRIDLLILVAGIESHIKMVLRKAS